MVLHLEAYIVDMMHVWLDDYDAFKLYKILLAVYNCIMKL
jgi:hypothetical protein